MALSGGQFEGGHPQPEVLAEYQDGMPDGARARAIEEHLDGCEQCARQVAEYSDMGRLLSTLPQRPVPRSFVLDDFTARRPSHPIWPAYASLAASLVLALGMLAALVATPGVGTGGGYGAESADFAEGGAASEARVESGGASAGQQAEEAADSATGAQAQQEVAEVNDAPAADEPRMAPDAAEAEVTAAAEVVADAAAHATPVSAGEPEAATASASTAAEVAAEAAAKPTLAARLSPATDAEQARRFTTPAAAFVPAPADRQESAAAVVPKQERSEGYEGLARVLGALAVATFALSLFLFARRLSY